jgi:2-iminobutanoate/2-iminopropanoate deaminase
MRETEKPTPQAVLTEKAPAPIGPYSQAIRIGDLLFCSGQIPLDPATGELVGGEEITEQTRQVMRNIGAVLEAAGASFDDVVKTTIYLIDMADFSSVNAVYGEAFTGGGAAPARSTVAVAGLPRGARVEIEVTAVV